MKNLHLLLPLLTIPHRACYLQQLVHHQRQLSFIYLLIPAFIQEMPVLKTNWPWDCQYFYYQNATQSKGNHYYCYYQVELMSFFYSHSYHCCSYYYFHIITISRFVFASQHILQHLLAIKKQIYFYTIHYCCYSNYWNSCFVKWDYSTMTMDSISYCNFVWSYYSAINSYFENRS